MLAGLLSPSTQFTLLRSATYFWAQESTNHFSPLLAGSKGTSCPSLPTTLPILAPKGPLPRKPLTYSLWLANRSHQGEISKEGEGGVFFLVRLQFPPPPPQLVAGNPSSGSWFWLPAPLSTQRWLRAPPDVTEDGQCPSLEVQAPAPQAPPLSF